MKTSYIREFLYAQFFIHVAFNIVFVNNFKIGSFFLHTMASSKRRCDLLKYTNIVEHNVHQNMLAQQFAHGILELLCMPSEAPVLGPIDLFHNIP